MKKVAIFLLLSGVAAGLFSGELGSEGVVVGETLRVATTTGPHAEILYAAREMAIKDGVKIEILEYDDNLKPNDLLLSGKVDANSFQTLPYFDGLVADRRLPFVAVAKTIVFPMALYSQKVTRLADLPPGATVAVPNDPIGGGRALLLLEKVGLISLRSGASLEAAVDDIVANPRNIKVIEVDAADIGRRLGEFDLAALGSIYAAASGLIPGRDALASEGQDSPYPHIIAVRAKDADNPAVQKFIAAYHSDHVKDFIRRRFQGTIVTTW